MANLFIFIDCKSILELGFVVNQTKSSRTSIISAMRITKWKRLLCGNSNKNQFDLYFSKFNFNENSMRWHSRVNQENAASAYNMWTWNEAMKSFCWNFSFETLNICMFIISKNGWFNFESTYARTQTHNSCCVVDDSWIKWKRHVELCEVKSSDNWMRQHTVCFG